MENPNTTKPLHERTHHKPVGPVIGSAIVIIILLIGGLYIWAQQLNKQEQRRQESQKSEVEQERELERLKAESANDLRAIQAEIDALGTEVVPTIK